jgi:hypothetical protein
MKIWVASKVVMFQQCLAYKEAIIMCYDRQIKALAKIIPLAQTWAIAKTICDILSYVVTTCVVNQCSGYWLLSNSLAFAIKLYVKLSKERLELQVESDAIEKMDMHMKVKQLGANIQGQVITILKPFLNFMFSFKPIKAHNMVTFMLNP